MINVNKPWIRAEAPIDTILSVGRTIYRNLTIWDGVSEEYSDAESLTVENAIIGSVGGATTNGDCRDMSGFTVVPGLIDAHVHMTLDPAIRTPEEQIAQPDDVIKVGMAKRAEDMVRAGITSARDLGGGKWLELELRDRINVGELIGPRLLCAGQPITSVKGHCHFWGGEAADTTTAIKVIELQAEHGVDLIKIMATGGMMTKGSSPREAQFDSLMMTEIVQAAWQYGYRVAAHCHGTDGIQNAAKARVNTIEHCSWLGDDGARTGYDPKVAFEIAKNGVWVSPTINAGWKRFTGGNGKFELAIKEIFHEMREAGIRLIASTDAGIPNVRHHDLAVALPVFANFANLTPIEALRSATSDCAEAIGLGDITGRIAQGFSADLMFVRGDPLSDLSVLEDPVLVVVKGQEIRVNDGT